MRFLQIISSLDPSGGGPAEVILQVGLELKTRGHHVLIVTLDDPSCSFLESYPIEVVALGPSRGGYRFCPKLVPWLRNHVTAQDVIIVNGLWQYPGFGTWRALHGLGVPYYVFPHGMLDPWFKSAYPMKHAKKWLYWPWAEYRVLRDAEAVLFTAEEERLLARQSFWMYRARERIVTLGTRAPPADAPGLRDQFLSAFPSLRGCRPVVFLGRLHVKKGCDLLIRAFAEVRDKAPTLRLVMAGPDATGWRPELESIARRAGVADQVVWTGMLQGPMKWGALYAAELFILPSHQENFGIAIVEALSCRVPVLISRKVNIWREVTAGGAGLAESDDEAGTSRMLGAWLAMSDHEREAMRSRALQLFQERFSVSAVAQSLIDATGPKTQPVA